MNKFNESDEVLDKIYNINVEKLVNDIKELSELQKYFKNQRKTKYIKGDRYVNSDYANYQHVVNRFKLRALYLIYGLYKKYDLNKITGNTELLITNGYFSVYFKSIIETYSV